MAASRNPWAGIVGLSSLSLILACQEPGASDWSRFRAPPTELEFAVSFPESVTTEPQNGRVILVVSNVEEGEPRFQVEAGPGGQQVFGVDVVGLAIPSLGSHWRAWA
jgi:hypothetical protein